MASSRVLRSDGRTLPLFSDGEGLLLLGWRVWDSLTMAAAERLRWEPYRRRTIEPAGRTAAGPPGGSIFNIDAPPQVKVSQDQLNAPLGNLANGAKLSANSVKSGQAWILKPISPNG